MLNRKFQIGGPPAPRTPSPSESLESISSSSTYVSANSSSSSPPSSPSSESVLATPGPYSTAMVPPRLRRGSPPQTLLGAIDENSGSVQPDLPLSAETDSNPVTKLHAYVSAPKSKRKLTIASTSAGPPSSEFDFLVGPNGESFVDLRMNRKPDGSKGRGAWKRLMCFA